MITSPIFTLLPRLKTAQLFAEHFHTATHPLAFYDVFDNHSLNPPSFNHIMEVKWLSQGIHGTKIQKISLSGYFETLYLAVIPNLTPLTLNCTRELPVVPILPGRLSSLQTHALNRSLEHFKDGALGKVSVGTRDSTILACLSSLRTLEFSCGAAAEQCSIPDRVQHIIIRPAAFDAVIWSSTFLKTRKDGLKLKQIDMYWPDDSPVHAFWLGYEKGVEDTGMVVTAWQRGEGETLLI